MKQHCGHRRRIRLLADGFASVRACRRVPTQCCCSGLHLLDVHETRFRCLGGPVRGIDKAIRIQTLVHTAVHARRSPSRRFVDSDAPPDASPLLTEWRRPALTRWCQRALLRGWGVWTASVTPAPGPLTVPPTASTRQTSDLQAGPGPWGHTDLDSEPPATHAGHAGLGTVYPAIFLLLVQPRWCGVGPRPGLQCPPVGCGLVSHSRGCILRRTLSSRSRARFGASLRVGSYAHLTRPRASTA
jgi:hypothetical protein